MTGDEFVATWADRELRQYVVDQARRHSKNPEDQEDYIQEAWMRIAEADANKTEAYYEDEAYRAIHAAWKRDYRRKQAENGSVDISDPPNVHSKGEGKKRKRKYRVYLVRYRG
jgi:DNA-directed RNA polymerase specialized sigma24 family protein